MLEATVRQTITRRGKFTTHRRFLAETTEGELVGQSEVFDADYTGVHKHKPEHRQPHEALIALLVADGWEVLDQGERWYETRLGRPRRDSNSRRPP